METMKCLFILAALFMGQIQCTVVRDDSNEDSGEITIVPTAIYQIAAAVIDVVTGFAINAIHGLDDNITTVESQFSDIQKVLIDKLWDFIVKKLNEADLDVSDFTNATIQCALENGDDLKSAVYGFSSQSVICEIQKMAETLVSALPMILDVRNTNEDWKTLIQEIKDCNSETQCINDVADEMVNEFVKLGTSLKDELALFSESLNDINDSATECHGVVEDNMQSQLKKISTTISECIQQKILNTTRI